MPTIFKIDYPNAGKPIKQEVEKIGYPNPDADGEIQYENTHFDDEGKAWTALEKELQAMLHYSTKSVINAELDLAKAKDELARVAIMLDNAKKGLSEFFDKSEPK